MALHRILGVCTDEHRFGIDQQANYFRVSLAEPDNRRMPAEGLTFQPSVSFEARLSKCSFIY